MSTLLSIVAGFLAFFFSSFLFWRRSREDLPPGKMFSFTLILFLGGILGGVVAKYLPSSSGSLANSEFWIPFLLVLPLTLYLVKKLELRLFDVLDSLIPSLLLFIFIYALGLNLSGGFSVWLLAEAGLALFGLGIYRFFQGRYRRFSFYPSGKVGFLGLATLSLYFFARFFIAILSAASLASGVIASGIISLVLSFLFLLAVYLRSGRRGAEKLIFIWRK